MRTMLLASAFCAAAACNAAEDVPPAQAPTTTAMLVPLTPSRPAEPSTARAQTSTETSSDQAGYVHTAPLASTWATSTPGASRDVSPRDDRGNQRDDGATLTPMDQGNSSDELRITASIRKSLMRDSSLSFGAKNVEIITVGTTVTLRGRVKNSDERATIDRLARDAAGVANVDDQLEVR